MRVTCDSRCQISPMLPLYQVLTALISLFSPTTCSVLKARAQIPENAELMFQINHTTTISANDTTIFPNRPSLDVYWPTNLAAPNLTLPATNTSASDTLSVGPPKYTCNGAAYGRNLRVQSCTDALNSMADFHQPRTFGQRGEGDWDVNLPFRFLSSALLPHIHHANKWHQY